MSMRALLLAATLSVGACASYVPRPLGLEQARADWRVRTLESRTEWGRAELLALALAQNPSLEQARATHAKTRAAERTAREIPNPTVSLGGEYDLTRAAESPWLWSIATSLLLDGVNGRSLREARARAGTRGADADFRDAVWTVRRDLREALLADVLGRRKLALLSTQVALQQRLLTLADARVQAGESPAGEARRLALDLAAARQGLADAQVAVRGDQARLATALGVPVPALATAALQFESLDELPSPTDAQLEGWTDEALLVRGDVERAIADYEARELELRQAMGAQRFQVALGPGYTYDHGIRKVTVGLSLAVPVFNRGEGAIGEADAAREEAGRLAQRVQIDALGEIAAARAAYADALVAFAAAAEPVRTSAAQLDEARRRLVAGDGDRPAELAAESVAVGALLTQLGALERAQQALGALEDALRRPLTGPEAPLSRAELQRGGP